MTTSALRRAIAERLGVAIDKVNVSLDLAGDIVILRATAPGVVADTTSDDLAARVYTSSYIRHGRAIYIVRCLGADDEQGACQHLLTLIDDVAGLVVS